MLQNAKKLSDFLSFFYHTQFTPKYNWISMFRAIKFYGHSVFGVSSKEKFSFDFFDA